MDLAQRELWQKVEVDVIAGSDQPSPKSHVEAIATFYAPPAFERRDVLLSVVADPYSGRSYLVHGYQAFYLSTKDDLLAFLVDSRFLKWTGSFAKTPGSQSGDAGTIQRLLEQVDDRRLLSTTLYQSLVDLAPHAPDAFFTGGSRGDSSSGIPTVVDAALNANTLRLELLSEGGRFRGTFLIDLATKTILESSVSGK